MIPHFLPAAYGWLEPVLIAAVIVFVVDLIGNAISFSNRILNALVTALVFTVIFGGLVFSGHVEFTGKVNETAPVTAPVNQ